MRRFLIILTVLTIQSFNTYSQIDSSLLGLWEMKSFPSYEDKGLKKKDLRFTMYFKNDTLTVNCGNRILCKYSVIDTYSIEIIKKSQTLALMEIELNNGFVYRPDDILDSIILAKRIYINYDILEFKKGDKLVAEFKKIRKK